MSEQHIPYPLLLAVALTQGLLLLLLHQAIEFDFWPGLSPHWLVSFYSMVVIAPTLLLLSYRSDTRTRLIPVLVGYALFTGLIGYYIGWQANPIGLIRYDTVLVPFILTQTLAALIALVYIDAYCEQSAFRFHLLLMRAWRHALTLAFAWLFTALSWGVLMLWGFLFEAIEIDFFLDLFTERWFVYPILSLLNGIGIGLFRQQFRIIDTVIKLVHLMLWVLLIPLSFISVIFLLALLVTGLEPLWASGGSFLILWMQILILLFANVSYQLHDDLRPYPTLLHWLVMAALLVLPIYSLISFYGLTLRIEQYGWTVERFWAITIWALVAAFAVSYAFAVIRQRTQWFLLAARQNIPLGLIVIAVLMLTQSPLLDFRKLSVQSQLARMDTSDPLTEPLDLRYFRYQLARPGYLALMELKETYAQSQPKFAAQIEAYYQADPSSLSFELFQQNLTLLTEADPALVQQIFNRHKSNSPGWLINRQLYLFAEQMDDDTELEFLFLDKQDSRIYITLYDPADVGWANHGPNRVRYVSNEEESDAFIAAVLDQKWETEASPFLDFRIGDNRIEF